LESSKNKTWAPRAIASPLCHGPEVTANRYRRRVEYAVFKNHTGEKYKLFFALKTLDENGVEPENQPGRPA